MVERELSVWGTLTEEARGKQEPTKATNEPCSDFSFHGSLVVSNCSSKTELSVHHDHDNLVHTCQDDSLCLRVALNLVHPLAQGDEECRVDGADGRAAQREDSDRADEMEADRTLA